MVALTSKKAVKANMCPQQGRENLGSGHEDRTSDLERMVLWFFGADAAATSEKLVDADGRLLHSFERLIRQIHIWCGEPSPAECTDMRAGTTSRESVSAVIIWL